MVLPPPFFTLFPYTTLFRSPPVVSANIGGLPYASRIAFGDTKRKSVRVWYSGDRKSTRLNSSHGYISYAVFCLKKKNNALHYTRHTRPTSRQYQPTRPCHRA